MAKNKKTVGKDQRSDLNRKQRRILAKQIQEASTFTTDEIRKEIDEHPNGKTSVQCCIEMMWQDFAEKFGLKAPVRSGDMKYDQWKEEMASFDRFVEHEKNVALFWYFVGLNHHQEVYKQFVDALDGKVPEEETEEKPETEE